MNDRRSFSALTLVWLVVLLVLPAPMMLTLSLGLPVIHLGSLPAMQMGVVAYTWMLAAVLLSVRPRWLDRAVGLPHIYVVHGVIGLLAVVAALAHDLFSSSTGLVKQTGTLALILLISLACWSIVFMSGWLTSRIPLLARIRSLVERLVHHETSVWLHRLNLLAVLLVFVHVQLIDYVSSIRWFMVVLDVMTALTLLLYVLGKARMRRQALHGRLVAHRMIAPRVHELTVRVGIPATTTWEAGDFAFIRFPGITGMHEYHPFSIVNAPSSDERPADGGDEAACPSPREGAKVVLWTFAIREDGDFTRGLRSVAVGSEVGLLPPYGRIQRFLEEHRDSPIVIISGGIGVTPMMAVAERFTRRMAAVVYTAKRGELLPYAERLHRLSQRHDGPVIIQEGRLSRRQMEDVVIPGAVYLIAGPGRMRRTWARFLKGRGVPSTRMYDEPFAW
ncbi:hypothetical protein [uncultured Bifidobacterium sp.]|uniref:hypothetical protein n=1 Tax=uncultured Bifidobacterium sp. TaxID=165187 RepID=UPI00261938A8|nr:hypothetical protein [uncultured Bifidobacterium sp.]